jgi:hypothetical protein
MKSHSRKPWLRAVLCTVAVGLIAAPAAAAKSAPVVRHGANAAKHKVGRGTSTNWSGYAVDGSSATNVIGTWTEPTVKCATGENSWSSPWVGIDGDTSNTVEQTGTDSDCQRGVATYYAWYEMYPKSTVVAPLTIHPGDVITGQVSYAPGALTSSSFTMMLTDHTSGKSFSTTQTTKKANRSSVEWIMEGPSSGLLSNFGAVSFSAASATINNQTAALGSLGAGSITMITGQGSVTRAQPSSISGGTSFKVNWQHS